MKKYIIISLLAVSGILPGCTKNEFMPPPVGEIIPYGDSTKALQDYIAEDKDHSVFWRLWNRSGMESKLKKLDPDFRFSLFIPNNDAMNRAGYDGAWISTSSVEELEKVASYHVTPVQILPNELKDHEGNIVLHTLLREPGYKVMGNNFFRYYGEDREYSYDVGVVNNEIRINNRKAGMLDHSAVLKKASIFPITRVLSKPRKSSRQFLYEDGRFSLYMAIRNYNDSLYSVYAGEEPLKIVKSSYGEDYLVTNGFFYGDEKNNSVNMMMLDYLSDTNYIFNTYSNKLIVSKEIYHLTLLAPTNEAFNRAGFYNLQDLIDFNNRVPASQSFGIGLCLPTDSILNHHFFGSNNRATENIVYHNYYDQFIEGVVGPQTPMIYYTNELKNQWIGNPITRFYTREVSYDLTHTAPPLNFIHGADEKVQVKVQGSSYEAATIIEKDVETYTGVIQIVDRLLIPPGMKLK